MHVWGGDGGGEANGLGRVGVGGVGGEVGTVDLFVWGQLSGGRKGRLVGGRMAQGVKELQGVRIA